MNEELQAQALAAWLDACGSGAYIPAPPILDADVVEAIYALHPEFARPPRFNMDELLGELKHGPLAAKAQPPSLPEVEVSVLAVEPANKAPANKAPANTAPGSAAAKAPVAASRHRVETAPSDTSPRAASRQASRPNERVWSRWMTSGAVGFTAAAAAWLLVISGEPARDSAHDAAATATAAPAAPRPAADAAAEGAAAAGAGLAEVAAAPAAKAVVAEAALPLPADVAVVPLPASAPGAAPVAEVAAEATSAAALDIAQAAPPPPPQDAAQGLVADAPAADALAAPQRARQVEAPASPAPAAPMTTSAGAGNAAVIAESEAKSVKDASNVGRAEAASKAEMEADDAEVAASGAAAGPTYTDWRAGLSSDQRIRLEGAISSAEGQARRGDPGAAARGLQPFIVQPARAGLNVAARAAEFALQANDPRLATSLCERGLKLGGAGTQERSRVEALLAKARQQSATLQLPH